MTTKAIKISEENYKWLCQEAGELQKESGELISIDKVISKLKHRRSLSDLAGTWKMSDKDTAEIMTELREGWKKWDKQYA